AHHHAAPGEDDRITLDVLAHQPGERKILHLQRRRRTLRHHLRLDEVLLAAHVAILHQQAAVDAPVVQPLRLSAHPPRPHNRPVRQRRTFFFHVGRVVSISNAAGAKSGAMTHSTNRPGSVNCMAVASSTGRLKLMTPPKALSGSPSYALRKASSCVAPTAQPQGLLCLMTAAAGRENSRTRFSAASRSSRLLNESSLPCSTVAPATHPPGAGDST